MARTKKIPMKAITFVESLTIPEGPNAGKRLRLAPFQKDFIRGALDPETQIGVLSVGRGNAKTALSAALALGDLLGEWDEQPNREIVIAAKTREQGRIAWNFIRSFIDTMSDEIKEQVTIRQAPRLEIEFAGNGGGIIKVLSSDGKNALGLAPSTILMDERGHWPLERGNELEGALLSAAGKRHSKVLIISTSAPNDTHPFSEWLDEEQDGVYRQEHRAPMDAAPDDIEAIKEANPGAEFGIGASLDWLQAQAKRAVKRGGHTLTTWRLYNLNQRCEADNRNSLLTVDEWLSCETDIDDLPSRAGDCVVGIDLGGAASMTAAAFYWPATGRLETLGTFPRSPDLADRGAADGVKGRYVEMQERGELNTLGDKTVPIAPWLQQVLKHVEGENISALCMDGYKRSELGEAIDRAGIRVPLVWRRFGHIDGNDDCQRFRTAVYEGKLKHAPSLLMRSALEHSIVIVAPGDAIRLVKGKATGRIDAVSAAVLAVGEGSRQAGRIDRKAGVAVWA